MARQDISMDIKYGEVKTTDNLTGKTIYAFHMLDDTEGPDSDNNCYGEIIVPFGFDRSYRDDKGIHVHIPYRAVYKKLLIRLRQESSSGGIDYILNGNNNGIWFPVLCEDGNDINEIRLSEIMSYNEGCNFNLLLRDGYLALYSGAETDLEIRASKVQNEMFLLKAAPGNLYQYATTGVGLIDYLHSNLENNGLAAKLQSEFTADNMIVKNAYMDSSTGELLLEVEEKEGANG